MKPLPYGDDRSASNASRVERVSGYKRGGKVTDDPSTKISISIGGAPQQTADKSAAAAAGLSALAQAASPPAPPIGAPTPGGAGPGIMPPPGLGPRPPGMKRGGRAIAMSAGAANGVGRLQETALEKASGHKKQQHAGN